MSNTKHTPEPWPEPMAEYSTTPITKTISLSDYLRARACVNALAGVVEPEKYITMLKRDAIYVDDPEGVAMIEDELKQLRADIEVLRDALYKIEQPPCNYLNESGDCGDEIPIDYILQGCIETAREALAKVKEAK